MISYFNIRKFQSTQEVLISDGTNYYKSDIADFKVYEPTFSIVPDIISVEYQPGVIYETSFTDKSTVDTKPASWPQADGYIAKVATYISLQQAAQQAAILAANTPKPPATIADAQAAMTTRVYQYAALQAEKLVFKYSTVERDRWASIILPEAEAYNTSHSISSCPNLVAQTIARLGNPSIDTSSAQFTTALTSTVNNILAMNTSLQSSLNTITGIRDGFVDQINSFTQLPNETTTQAVSRLMALNYQTNWLGN